MTSVGLVCSVLSSMIWISLSLLKPSRDLTLLRTSLGSLLGSMVEVKIFHEFALLHFTKY